MMWDEPTNPSLGPNSPDVTLFLLSSSLDRFQVLVLCKCLPRPPKRCPDRGEN